MKKLLLTALAALPITIAAAQSAEAAHVGLTLNSSGDTIVKFDITDPTATSTIAISGDATRLDAFDFRPETGQLIGFDSATDRFFIVDANTGNTTEIVDPDPEAIQQSNNNDVDWNPTIDRMRLVTAQDNNVVFNPNNGATTAVTDLFYASGDANDGENPAVIGNAYTNSFDGAMSTTQYVLDAATDSLGILANNAGEITTVGQTTLNGSNYFFGTNGGFDIFFDSDTQTNTAYAVLFGQGLTSLFLVDIATGGLTKVGDFDLALGNLKGLAVGVVSDIPLPAALPLFLLGAAGLGFKSRRRKKSA